jgi:hypothetical protein
VNREEQGDKEGKRRKGRRERGERKVKEER